MFRLIAVTFACALLSTLMGTPVAASQSLDLNFEQNTCSTLYENLSQQGAISGPSIDCGDVGAALTGTTGNYPFWLGCLGYEDMPAAAHLARCAILSARVKTDAPTLDGLQVCEDILAFYEQSLRASSRTDSLPHGYSRPTCGQAEEARLLWSGSRPGWLRCRGYDRAEEKVHAAGCLLGESRLDRLDDCRKVRGLYEERLMAAYGEKPDGYRPIRCSNVEEIVEQATEMLEKLRSEQRAAQLRAAAQRVRTHRQTPQVNMEQLIKGFIMLRMQADQALANVPIPTQAEIATAASEINEQVRDGMIVLRERDTPQLSDTQKNFFRRDARISTVDAEVGMEPTHNLIIGEQE
ncbi:hypothetical protein [uncultured Roseobacter sp.]|uniref:hypothetical protein n=1 Tax=uncultured Roseobacter sp. TaxID=114847 RepID=UPI00262795DA|nr:hypothetical protein [uncultured Roseobacter sp.]